MLIECNLFISIYQTAYKRLATQTNQFRLLLNLQIWLVIETRADQQRKNLPIGKEVTAIIPDKLTDRSQQDLILAVCKGRHNCLQLHQINVTYAAYMPLHYVLLFLCSDYSQHYRMQLQDQGRVQEQTCLEQRYYYQYQLYTCNNTFSTLFYASCLF